MLVVVLQAPRQGWTPRERPQRVHRGKPSGRRSAWAHGPGRPLTGR